MDGLLTYTLNDGVATIHIDDGKANAMSIKMIEAINAALDKAEEDKAIVIITGREGNFSAGFDLKELGGGPEPLVKILHAGSNLCTRLLGFPTPVIAACSGHAFPMGAFILLSSDYRIGANGPFQMGMNEVKIGIAAPQFAMELARFRLSSAYLNRTAILGEMFSPSDAQKAGILDEVVEPSELMKAAQAKAEEMKGVHMPSHQMSKKRIRKTVIDLMKRVTEDEITLENAQRRAR